MVNSTVLVLSDKEYSSLMFMLGHSTGIYIKEGIHPPADCSTLINNLHAFNSIADSVYQSPGVDITQEVD